MFYGFINAEYEVVSSRIVCLFVCYTNDMLNYYLRTTKVQFNYLQLVLASLSYLSQPLDGTII